MRKLSLFASVSVASVVMAGSIAAPAFAWHPKGTITKSVQNITAGGDLSAADTPATAISAKPGDILQYTIEVKNEAAAASNHDNDMAFTMVTDTLPDGVELTADASKRSLTEDMGTITPGQSKKVTYQVKVTATTDGTLIDNKACFTGDSAVRDNPQSGCDTAAVKVTVPVTPAPTPTPTPSAPAPQQPAALPNTGVGSSAAAIGLTATLLGYAAYALRLKRKTA